MLRTCVPSAPSMVRRRAPGCCCIQVACLNGWRRMCWPRRGGRSCDRQGGEGEKFRMRVIVLGGAGNFGARIARALREDPTIDLLVAGRRLVSAPGAKGVPGVVVDIGAPDFALRLRAPLLSASIAIYRHQAKTGS